MFHGYDFTNIFYKNVNNIKITVKIISNSPSQPKLVRLNLPDKLSIVREQLERRNIINYTLSFADKFSENNNDNSEFAEIALEDEENFLLDDIIFKSGNNYILYLITCSKINWKFLNELRRLDYGCIMTFDEIKKAEKRAFKMKNCKLNEIDEYRKGTIEFKSNEDQMMKANLFFSADINVQYYVKLGMGMSIGKSKNEKSNVETNYFYYFTKYSKASLKFSEYLEPTPEFIEEVKEAIESKDPENFKQIIEDFGHFIPTEVILGGRVHFDGRTISNEQSIENSREFAINALEVKAKNTFNNSERKSNHYNSKCTKLIGGESNNLENFDEEAWVKSLKKGYTNWDCIEFRKPISIFQLLPDDLRKQVITSIGKRIHHLGYEEFNYDLEKPGKPEIFELKNIPPNISKIIQNKDADCNIFATVIDTTESSKNDFFTCQILCPPNEKPRLIIHCIQKTFKKRECRLKIGWIVIGYYTNFNFILSDFSTQLNILKNDFNVNTLNNDQIMFNTELLNFECNSEIPPCIGIPVIRSSSNDSLIIGHHFFNAQEENEEKKKIGACTFSFCSKKNCYVNLPNFTFYTLIISNYPIPNACAFTKSCLNPENPKFISVYSTKKTNCGPIFIKQRNGQIKIKYINCSNCKTCSICNDKKLKISEDNIKYAFFDPYIRIEEKEQLISELQTSLKYCRI